MSEKPSIRLMAHLVAGYPDLAISHAVAEGLVDGGAEILEVQFPYSDPTADGPAIQSACLRAVEAGFRVDQGFELIRNLSRTLKEQVPLFIMSYAGLVFARGIDAFLGEARENGATGVVIPDLTPDYDEGLFEAGRKRGLAVVPVIAPSVLSERLDRILALQSPFLYAAIRTGITGQHSAIDQDVRHFLEKVRRDDTALIAGFGITEHGQAKGLSAYADILVVGSAFVRAVHEALEAGGNPGKAVEKKALEIIGRTERVEEP